MRVFLLLFVFISCCHIVSAQKEVTYDLILKVNGDEMEGKVSEISDEFVKFTFKGESLIYNVKKSEILKIKFSSGRIEFFNRPSQNPKGDSLSITAQGIGPLAHHNKVAIMPFVYLIDKRSADEEVQVKVQSECYTILKNHSASLTIVDPITTNAILIKAGITSENMKGYTPSEICDILGVEYLVRGRVSQDKASFSTYQNSSTTAGSGSGKGNNKVWSSSSSSSSSQSYQTSLILNIFTDKGENIFSKEHNSFFNTNDAYKITLNYLLKRTPIYRQ